MYSSLFASTLALVLASTGPAKTPPSNGSATLAIEAAPSSAVATVIPQDDELICMAKAVHHEAANQPVRGQMALAQLIMHRSKARGFAATVCGVINQPGQFFPTRSYSPVHDNRWETALTVSRTAMSGGGPDIVPGAIFYRAAYAPRSWVANRARVAQIGAHIFYR